MKTEFFKNQARIEATKFNERYEKQSSTLTNFIKNSTEVIK